MWHLEESMMEERRIITVHIATTFKGKEYRSERFDLPKDDRIPLCNKKLNYGNWFVDIFYKEQDSFRGTRVPCAVCFDDTVSEGLGPMLLLGNIL